METIPSSFARLIACYCEMGYSLATLFLIGPALPANQNRMMVQRVVPRYLQEEYRLLQLPDEASLAEVRAQYRQLVKYYHPDAGGDHTGFLALQQAYGRVVEYLQARRGN
jgi:DnaJ domain